MWNDHPFSQINKAKNRVNSGGRDLGEERHGAGCRQNLKIGGCQYRGIFINE